MGVIMKPYQSLKKFMVIGIILLFFGISIISSSAQLTEEPYSSTSKGNWLYVGGNGPGNYSKIQDALDDAQDGDTVFIYDDSSPYNENIFINSSLSLLGENQITTQLNGKSQSHTITVNAPNTVISGLTISQTIIDHNSEFTNIFIKTDNNKIYNNTIINGKNGIYCLNCSTIIIQNLTISHCEYGLYLWQIHDSSINNNLISECITAVYGYTCKNCDFFKNTIYDSVDGFYMVKGRQNRYHYNNLHDNNNVGMSVDGDIQYNVITNSYYGAFVGQGVFSHNIIQNCNLGMESTGFITIKYNTIRNCSFRGIMVAYILTIVSHNNFFNNSDDASFEQAILTRWYGNYWHRPLYQPKIIIGYVGFWYISIPLINFDWSPAKEPYDIS